MEGGIPLAKRNKGRKPRSTAYIYAKEQEARASRLLKLFTMACAVVVVLAIGAGMFGGGRGGFANPHDKVAPRRPSQHELAVEYINSKIAENMYGFLR